MTAVYTHAVTHCLCTVIRLEPGVYDAGGSADAGLFKGTAACFRFHKASLKTQSFWGCPMLLRLLFYIRVIE